MFEVVASACVAALAMFTFSGCAGSSGSALEVRGTAVTTTNACNVGLAPPNFNDHDPGNMQDMSTQSSTVLAALPLASATMCKSILVDPAGNSKPVPTSAMPELTEALGRPDDESPDGNCSLEAWLGPTVIVVDATGRAINAHLPENGCGKTLTATREALGRITALVDASL